jgi:molybdopterin-guanine dinucleotide biosynthesis protein A
MAAERDVPSFMALTKVKPERADEFETFVREVVVPAAVQARPQAAGLWQTLRPDTSGDPSPFDAQGTAAGSANTYVFVFYGDLPMMDWELGSMFTDVHGEEKGRQLIEQFEDFLQGEQVVLPFSGEVA